MNKDSTLKILKLIMPYLDSYKVIDLKIKSCKTFYINEIVYPIKKLPKFIKYRFNIPLQTHIDNYLYVLKKLIKPFDYINHYYSEVKNCGELMSFMFYNEIDAAPLLILEIRIFTSYSKEAQYHEKEKDIILWNDYNHSNRLLEASYNEKEKNKYNIEVYGGPRIAFLSCGKNITMGDVEQTKTLKQFIDVLLTCKTFKFNYKNNNKGYEFSADLTLLKDINAGIFLCKFYFFFKFLMNNPLFLVSESKHF